CPLHRGDGNAVTFRHYALHVTGLASLLAAVRALSPLEIRHLLRQRPDLVARGIQSRGIERVTGGAELRCPNVLCLRRHEAAGRVHDRRVTTIHGVGTEDRPFADGRRRVDHEAAVEARALTKSVLLDLVARRTRDA